MRIMLTSGPLYGHVNTMLPLALAAQRAGHEVAFASGPDLVRRIERFGVPAWGLGPTHAQAGGNRHSSWVQYFAQSAEQRLADLLPRAMAWQPDIMIHEETELAGPIVACRTGAREVVHGLGLMPSQRMWTQFSALIDQIGRGWDAADAGERLGAEATYLHICPPALQPAGEPLPMQTLPLRPAAGAPVAGERLPDALDRLPFAHTIHLTLGTVFHDAADVLQSAIAGLRELPLNLVVTVGPGADPARLGPQPDHVLVAQYLPHDLLLPRCRLVVSQAGAGIMFGALSHGLPQLLLPQGAEQFGNADACSEAGAALLLRADEVSPQAVAAAAERLLGETDFELAARKIKAEIDAMPTADAVLATLTGVRPAGRAAAGESMQV